MTNTPFEFLQVAEFVKRFPADRIDELPESIIIVSPTNHDQKEACESEPPKREIRND